MRLIAFFLILLSIGTSAQEKNLRIGILRDRTVKTVVVMSLAGNCAIWIDGENRGELRTNDGLK
ncbi:MAG: hypothetical protein M3R08_06985, partial [Bacteroidota bacterium]|nr:hypothetical protein [Bacteroidota bacterium]